MAQKNDDEFKNIAVDALDRHNFYRNKHNVPLLEINPKLNKVSQDWADELAKTDNPAHRPASGYGENIFIMMSKEKVEKLGVKAVDSWYSEIKYFNFQGTDQEMSASTKSFHFTQVVWKGSKKLGVGASKSKKSDKMYVVCNYDSPGNILSQFKENVLPPKESDL